MKKRLIEASRAHFKAHIAKHQVNIETILNNPIAIPEHTNIMESIEKELEQMAGYIDKLEALEKYFSAE